MHVFMNPSMYIHIYLCIEHMPIYKPQNDLNNIFNKKKGHISDCMLHVSEENCAIHVT